MNRATGVVVVVMTVEAFAAVSAASAMVLPVKVDELRMGDVRYRCR